MNSFTGSLLHFFGAALKPQTYLNLLYLLLSFPLGIAYFIFFVTGFALGISLSILLIGLFILLGVFAGWYALVVFERGLAIALLREDIPPVNPFDMTGATLWQKISIAFTNPVTWKGLIYLVMKFPLGILSFVLLVTLLSTSGGLIASPFYYSYVPTSWNMTVDGANYYPLWLIDTLPEAVIAAVAGIFLLLISLHILNGLAWVSGKWARVMLGNFSQAPAAPVQPGLPQAELPEVEMNTGV